MTYNNNQINDSFEVLIRPSNDLTIYEALSLIDQMRATGRYSSIHIDGDTSCIVGVIA